MRIRIAAVAAALVAWGCPGWGGSSAPAGDTTPTMAQLRAQPTAATPHARILLRYPGVYRLTGADLRAAGADTDRVRPDRITLWNEGERVPVRVGAADPARLGPDDTIEFVGDSPRGTFGHFKPYNLHNVYLMTWDDGPRAPEPLQYRDEAAPAPPADAPPHAVVVQADHHETDFVHRHPAQPPGYTDGFHWWSYTPDAAHNVRLPVDFPALDTQASPTVSLSMRFIGATMAHGVTPHHKYDVYYGTHPKCDLYLGTFGFDGMGYHDFHTSIPVERIVRNGHIQLRGPEDRQDVVDMIFLEHFRTEYARRLDADGLDWAPFGIRQVIRPGQKPHETATITGLPPGSRVFAPGMGLTFAAADPATSGVTVRMGRTRAGDTATSLVAVTPAGFMRPDSVEARDGALPRLELPADTEALILHHPQTRRAARFLADYRRWQGMRAATVDVTDVFDLLSDGFIDDVALKRYIRLAATSAPGLRHVVLFGASTFDYREARTRGHEEQRHILIPIHWIVNPATTWTGGYPDDNWYTSFVWANTPEIAIGRIPANNDTQGFDYLRKVVEYEQLGRARDGRLLLVSSVERSFQSLVEEVATLGGDHFTTVSKLFPETSVAEREIQRLGDEFAAGIQVLYYVGHGGAMVWRVGPTDWKQQKDLFTPADVRRLTNRGVYPIIHAASCYTTAFDYPDSIGESFVLEPGRGGIAVIGTPWKAGVHEGHRFNKTFFEEYLNHDNERLGDAFVRTKHRLRPAHPQQVDFQDFTLLGDPTLRLTRRDPAGATAGGEGATTPTSDDGGTTRP